MWPDLMGPGWVQQLMMTVGLLGVVVATLMILAAAASRLDGAEGPDPLLGLWHRYEEGDLTRQEFDRLRRHLPREGSAVARRSAGVSRTARRPHFGSNRGGAQRGTISADG
jgi:hypothetical protein